MNSTAPRSDCPADYFIEDRPSGLLLWIVVAGIVLVATALIVIL